MYSNDPVIDDIVLTIINDGNGSECGMSYKERCLAAQNHGLFEFRAAAKKYAERRVKVYEYSKPTTQQVIEAANIAYDYYCEHIKEDGVLTKTSTLFDDVKAAGIPYSSHESDLYLPNTAEVRALLQKHGKTATAFTNQVEGGTWLDVPFAYLPWWQKRGGNV